MARANAGALGRINIMAVVNFIFMSNYLHRSTSDMQIIAQENEIDNGNKPTSIMYRLRSTPTLPILGLFAQPLEMSPDLN